MSITYTNDNGTIQLGGGGTNPYPRYSVQTSPQMKADHNYGTVFTIAATATYIATGDITSTGARSQDIAGEVAAELLKGGGLGTLTINTVGGGVPLIFTNCRLQDISASEQDDTSQGVLTQEFTATFEAYKMSYGATNSDGFYGNLDDGLLEDFNESWEWSITEQNAFDPSVGDLDRQWQCTYTVSATGRGSTTESGHKIAKDWVTGRTNNIDPLNYQDITGVTTTLDGLDSSGTLPFNKVTSRSEDVAAGSYSESITWVYSKYEAVCVVELSGNFAPREENNTVDVNVTVTGLENDSEGQGSAKYTNALAFYNAKVLNNISGWATTFYNEFISPLLTVSRSLNSNAVSKSFTKNETDGVLTISTSFDDKEISENGILEQSVTITDTNIDGGNEIVAILPVIAKSNGPVIQDMATTGERTRSISLDLTMDQENRASKPTTLANGIIAPYKPTGVTVYYRQNRVEAWNPFSGTYNLSEDYVWTDDEPTN